MKKVCLQLFLLTFCFGQLKSQMRKEYVPCNDMPNIIQTYYADVTALNRVYIVEGSPEKRDRYKKLAEDYVQKLNDVSFDALTEGCKVDFVLFKRDLEETIYHANEEVKDYARLKQWFPFAETLYALEKVRRRGGLV